MNILSLLCLRKGENKMPETKKFRKMKRNMIKQYGQKKGTKVAHATAQKRGWRH